MFFQWIIGELASYHLVTLCVIAAIAFFASRQWKLLGTFAGHILIAIIIGTLDIRWIESEMQKPGRDPNEGPDMDIGFMIGGVLRIIAVNAVLLPIGFLGLYAALRRKARLQSTSATGHHMHESLSDNISTSTPGE